ncbi:MAG: hypothetical protein ABIL01_30580 [Pseudomonadota bacterium]
MHEFQSHRTFNLAFLAAAAFGLVGEGVPAPSDMARVGMGGKVGLNDSVSFTTDFQTDLYRTPTRARQAFV